MLCRLNVKGYKSLTETEIDFAQVTFLLGLLGAGKSNILRSIMALPADAPGKMAWVDMLKGKYADAKTAGEAYGIEASAWEDFLSRSNWPPPKNPEQVHDDGREFLPIIVDISNIANFGGPNVVAVYADNSDDPLYPPGKPQNQLDFSYFGGIYRDVWFIVKDKVHITHEGDVLLSCEMRVVGWFLRADSDYPSYRIRVKDDIIVPNSCCSISRLQEGIEDV